MTARDEARLLERWEDLVARDLRRKAIAKARDRLLRAERRRARARSLEARTLATMGGAW